MTVSDVIDGYARPWVFAPHKVAWIWLGDRHLRL